MQRPLQNNSTFPVAATGLVELETINLLASQLKFPGKNGTSLMTSLIASLMHNDVMNWDN